MNKYSLYETYRFVAMPYEQFEPPFQLPPPKGLLTAALRKRLARVIERCRDRIRINRSIAALSKLEDWQLRDIGIDRDRIHAEARRAVAEIRGEF